MSKWHAFPKVPKKTGKYIVAHRGHEVIMYYLDPREGVYDPENGKHGKWDKHAKLGWQGDLSFGPTHWRLYEHINVPETEGYDRFSLAPPKKKPYYKELTFLERLKNKFFCKHWFNDRGVTRFTWHQMFGPKVLVTITAQQCTKCGKCKTRQHETEIVNG